MTQPIYGKPESFWSIYLLPLMVSVGLIIIIQFSGVGLKLWVVEGLVAQLIVGAYILTLLLSMKIQDHPIVHEIGVVLAVMTFLGRGGGFLELVLSESRADLLGAVAERLMLTYFAVNWHNRMAWRAGLLKSERRMAAIE